MRRYLRANEMRTLSLILSPPQYFRRYLANSNKYSAQIGLLAKAGQIINGKTSAAYRPTHTGRDRHPGAFFNTHKQNESSDNKKLSRYDNVDEVAL